MNTGRTHSDSRLAFPSHADYGCAVTQYPRLTVWGRIWRLFGGSIYRFD